MKSIASSQLRTMLIGGVCISLLAGALVLVLARHALLTQFNDTLIGQAEFLGTLVDYSEEGILEFEEGATDASTFGEVENPGYFQIWSLQAEPEAGADSTTVLDRSASLDDETVHLDLRVPHEVGVPVLADALTPDGRKARSVSLLLPVTRADDDLDPAEQQRLIARNTMVVVVIVEGTETILPLLMRISAGVGIAGVFMILGFLGLAILTVRKGLEPIIEANRSVAAIDSSCLITRLNADEAPRELRPLLTSINELLGRLEESFSQERVSRAMLAHELRNPIAELLMTAEIASKWPDDTELAKRSMDKVLCCARELQDMIRTMLRIARVQAGQEEPHWEEIEAATILRETLDRCLGIALTRDLTISESIASSSPVRTDPDLLRFVMINLMTNAVEHASLGGDIEIRLDTSDETIRLYCANTVDDPESIDCDQIVKAFQSGSTQALNDRHAGIGLTAISTICGVLGVDVRLSVESDRFVARIELPISGRRAA